MNDESESANADSPRFCLRFGHRFSRRDCAGAPRLTSPQPCRGNRRRAAFGGLAIFRRKEANRAVADSRRLCPRFGRRFSRRDCAGSPRLTAPQPCRGNRRRAAGGVRRACHLPQKRSESRQRRFDPPLSALWPPFPAPGLHRRAAIDRSATMPRQSVARGVRWACHLPQKRSESRQLRFVPGLFALSTGLSRFRSAANPTPRQDVHHRRQPGADSTRNFGKMRIRFARRRFVPVLFSLSFAPRQTGTSLRRQFPVDSRRGGGARSTAPPAAAKSAKAEAKSARVRWRAVSRWRSLGAREAGRPRRGVAERLRRRLDADRPGHRM